MKRRGNLLIVTCLKSMSSILIIGFRIAKLQQFYFFNARYLNSIGVSHHLFFCMNLCCLLSCLCFFIRNLPSNLI